MKVRQFSCGILLAAFCAGCGTLTNNDLDRRPYRGVIFDIELATGDTGSCMAIPLPCMILDVPFSFVGDTLVLPFDMYSAHLERKYQEEIKRNPLDPDPLTGWIYNYAGNTNVTLEKDLQAYIQSLPSEQKRKKRYVNWHKNNLGDDAVQITIGTHWIYSTSVPMWTHVLFYDQNQTRIRVMKYEKGHLCP